MSVTVLQGDCLQVMQDLALIGEQVDAIVTDPPYHLTQISRGGSPRGNNPETPFGRTRLGDKGFMGQNWDGGDIAFRVETWRRAYDLLKPGGHLLAFAATRGGHRMACAIEDAGFEIRDCVGWMFGTGFPKSLNVSSELEKIGSPDAAKWGGFGTALKPAWEMIYVARKPLSEKTVAANVLAHGTGALNIDACRIASDGGRHREGEAGQDNRYAESGGSPLGRWPANCIHDGSEEVLAAFAAFGEKESRPGKTKARGESVHCYGKATQSDGPRHNDTGTAARFFYSAKASKSDRAGSTHPTVKPLSLMKYLCRLVCPPGGTVLDMFAGSGTTLQAAVEEGFNAIGIEREDEYFQDCKRRLGIVDPAPEDDVDAFLAELVS